VDWVLILVVAAVAVAGACALAAAIAAGGSDRAAEGTADERAAIWQAGYSARELRVLAGLAAVAHVDLGAEQVEVVLKRAGDGVVVTGSALPPGRLGQGVPYGDGVAGRALAAGRTALAAAGDDEPAHGLVAIATPIPAADGIAGVVVATAGERALGPADVSRLEALAAAAGARLGNGAPGVRHAG
jgi:hypothetical protein